jgi:uncharacterized protein with GYD domain
LLDGVAKPIGENKPLHFKERRRSMPTFIMTGSWTDQGIRGVKEAPNTVRRAKDRKVCLEDF